MLELTAKTIKHKISAKDFGVASNKEISLTLIPSKIGSGIRFIRTDIIEGNNIINVKPENIAWDVHLNTCLSNGNTRIMFVEHILCALWMLNIKNLDIEINGPEIPLFDGSAKYFISMINSAGIKNQDDKYKLLKLKKTIRVERENNNSSYILANPSETFKVSYNIDYDVKTIMNDKFEFDLSIDNFENDISNARTFCLENEDRIRREMFSDGWNEFNNVKFGDTNIVSPEKTLRYKNEATRHKILDVIGDISIMNFKILAELDCHKSGHRVNHLLIKEILSNEENYELI